MNIALSMIMLFSIPMVQDGCADAAHEALTRGKTHELKTVVKICVKTVDEPVSVSPTPLPTHRLVGGVEQWRDLVTKYWPSSAVNRALCVIDWESIGGDPNATNPSSGAAGLFQHIPRFWSDRSKDAGWGGANIYDPEANIAVGAWLYRVYGWSPWKAVTRGVC